MSDEQQTGRHEPEVPAAADSPYEVQPIDGLPLTKTERAALKVMIARLDADHHASRPTERAQASASDTG